MATEGAPAPIPTPSAEAGTERSDRPRGPRGGRGRGQSGGRGRGGGRGGFSDNQNGARRGDGRSHQYRGNRGHAHSEVELATTDKSKLGVKPEVERGKEEEEDNDAEVCFICASPVEHNSVGPCNHRTCHICALRMRALYKDINCAHCRVSFSMSVSPFKENTVMNNVLTWLGE